jgi:uncharacterized protein
MHDSYFASTRDVRRQLARQSVRQNLIYILSLRGESHWLALSFAIGIFIGMSPLYGAHTVLTLTLVSVFRFNLTTMFIGAWMTFPPTLPFVYYFCYRFGRVLLPAESCIPRAVLFDTIDKIWHLNFAAISVERKDVFMILKQLTLGCTVLGVFFSVLGYFLLKSGINTYRNRIALRRAAKVSTFD